MKLFKKLFERKHGSHLFRNYRLGMGEKIRAIIDYVVSEFGYDYDGGYMSSAVKPIRGGVVISFRKGITFSNKNHYYSVVGKNGQTVKMTEKDGMQHDSFDKYFNDIDASVRREINKIDGIKFAGIRLSLYPGGDTEAAKNSASYLKLIVRVMYDSDGGVADDADRRYSSPTAGVADIDFSVGKINLDSMCVALNSRRDMDSYVENLIGKINRLRIDGRDAEILRLIVKSGKLISPLDAALMYCGGSLSRRSLVRDVFLTLRLNQELTREIFMTKVSSYLYAFPEKVYVDGKEWTVNSLISDIDVKFFVNTFSSNMQTVEEVVLSEAAEMDVEVSSGTRKEQTKQNIMRKNASEGRYDLFICTENGKRQEESDRNETLAMWSSTDVTDSLIESEETLDSEDEDGVGVSTKVRRKDGVYVEILPTNELDESLLYMSEKDFMFDHDKYTPTLNSAKEFWKEIVKNKKKDLFFNFVFDRIYRPNSEDVDVILAYREPEVRAYLNLPYKIDVGIEVDEK